MGIQAWTKGDGPLVAFADGFRRDVLQVGHTPAVARYYVLLMGQLNRWLAANGLAASDLTDSSIECFLESRRVTGQRRVPTMASMGKMVSYLERIGAVMPQAKPCTDTDELMAAFREHLVRDRGLMEATIRRYENFAKRFLTHWRQEHLADGPDVFASLCATDVHAFMLEAASRLATVESAKREAADLRAFLRFLYLSRRLATDLGSAMPPVAVWRGARLPSTLAQSQVDRLLATCDRATVTGRRDFAVMVLLARLGLRSGEVASLKLEDIDWRAGEIVVRGKARRQDRMPLQAEVGEALSAYLVHDRPASHHRNVILTLYPPPRPLGNGTITSIVYRACQRGGLDRFGGHRLRHALATEMLRKGGDLMEISQVLRHSDLGTTSAYAKVDYDALRAVVHPWPGGRP